MAKFAQMADAHKQQQDKADNNTSGIATGRVVTAVADQDQRKALKFGFSSKIAPPKISNSGATKKKTKIPVASVFGNDSDEEQ